jgi:hypothetical protein
MGWLDASECFLMEVVVRDRHDDIRSTFDLTRASDDRADAAASRTSTQDRAWRPCGVGAQS